MPMFDYPGAMVSTVIAATPDMLWPILSDVTRHPELAGSKQVVHVELLTPPPLKPGARFRAQQRMLGLNYVTESHVVAYDPLHRLTWRIGLPGMPPLAQIWQFELIPFAGGTLVEHSVVLPYALPQFWPFTLIARAIARAEIDAMTPTLVNLATLAGVEAPTIFETHRRPPASTVVLLPLPIIQGSLWMLALLLLVVVRLRRKGKQRP